MKDNSNEVFDASRVDTAGEAICAGACGASGGVVWSLSEDRSSLTIGGAGAMDDFPGPGSVPWRGSIDLIARVEVKSGVTSVGDYAFKGARSLTDVILAGSVDVLGTFSFAGCISLTEISLPEGLTVIGAKAFAQCLSLVTVRLPSTLTNIDMKAFNGADRISEVFFAGSQDQWRRVNASRSALGNASLLNAQFHYGKPDDGAFPASSGERSDNYDLIIAEARAALGKNGDGKLYALFPDLTIPGMKIKSGDCSLIIFPDGKTMMIDAGSPDCSPVIISLIKDLGLSRLDYFMLSHPHKDHVGGVLDTVKYIYESGGSINTYYIGGDTKTGALECSVREYLIGKGVNITAGVRAGEKWRIGEVEAEIFCPEADLPAKPGGGEEDMNNLSIAMKLTYGKSTYLTSGDLYAEKERILAEKYGAALRADVIKANHHGLYTSNSPLWIETVSPKIVIAPADDIGGTLLTRRMAAAGISYYSVGMGGLTMVTMDDGANYEVLCRRGSMPRGAEYSY